jgi:hypothetical protein
LPVKDIIDVVEQKRLNDAREAGVPWKKWGPYLSERQWGTVREDYSKDGNAWDYFSHDQSRSRAYHWGEDGLAGISDDKQHLCFALALWNERDPILKERLFGLTNSEGNHGEDVKEYYFYIDSTPTHSYMKYLYKYPQQEFPYRDLVETNRRRSREDYEYELLDTGIFNDDRYFDVFVEYAKEGPEDLLIRVTVHNRGPEAARLRLLPTLWFRNTWSWENGDQKPVLRQAAPDTIQASHNDLGHYYLYCDGSPELLFTENETNAHRLWGQPNPSPYVKDAFHACVVSGDRGAANPGRVGTKAAADYTLAVPVRGSKTVRLRLTAAATSNAFKDFDAGFQQRIADADEFYNRITPRSLNEDERRVYRQAIAGMLWSKQFYYFDVERWLDEHKTDPLESDGHLGRNSDWFHMLNADVISMPDKWEYPWYAAWDLAFHTLALSMVDFDFAKEQLLLMTRTLYFHPNGQIPAYEWNFSDVNPPVHAFATLFLFKMERALGRADLRFLERSFQTLMLNFTWWVNRKDPSGRNVFGGGFLGLDNIGVFDRSAQLPTGGSLEQADGTAWMAFYCECMLEIALILCSYDPIYEEMAFKFVQHFAWIAYAMDRIGGSQRDNMWDEEDGFFYDVLRLPDGEAKRLKVRSMVGLLPLCATTFFEADDATNHPKLMEMIELFKKRHPEVVARIAPTEHGYVGYRGRRLFSVLNKQKLERVLGYMLDENEFLGPHGIRALSRYHLDHPFSFWVGNQEYTVPYLPAESNTGLFGGNSNWRGPVWMPVNLLILRGLLNLYGFYGDEFKVQCPTGSGHYMTLFEVAKEIERRLSGTFLRDANGRRPVYGGTKKFQDDPHWRDLILFYEYFHGDNGAGLGASHQTGWTGTIAFIMDIFARFDAKRVLEGDRRGIQSRLVMEQVGGESPGEPERVKEAGSRK